MMQRDSMSDDNLHTRTSSSSSSEFEFNILCEDSPVSPRFPYASPFSRTLRLSDLQEISHYNALQRPLYGTHNDYVWNYELAAWDVIEKGQTDQRSLMLQERQSKNRSVNASDQPRGQDVKKMKDIDQSLPAMSASSSKSISDSQCISCHGAINPAALPKAPTASICKLHCLFRRICHQRHHYRSCRIHHEASTAVQQENQCRTSCRSSRNCRLWKATNYSVRNERPTASTDSDPISETYKNVANHPHLDTVCHSACLSNMSDTHLCRDKQNLNSVSIQDKEENNTINESIDVTIYVKKPVRDDRYSVSATANDVKDPAQDNKGSPILSTLSPLQRYHKKTHRAGQNMRKTFLPYRQSLQLGAFFGFHPVTQSALTPYLAQH